MALAMVPVALLLSVLVSPLSAAAQPRAYELSVRGLGCTFRAHGLERELLRIEGVRDVKLHLAEGRVSMTLAAEATVMPGELGEHVREAGLVLEGIEATVVGTVRGRRLSLGGGRVLVLQDGAGTEALEELVKAGKRTVEARGPVVREGDGWAIEVASVREPPADPTEAEAPAEPGTP